MSGRVLNSAFYQTIRIRLLGATNYLPSRISLKTSGGSFHKIYSRSGLAINSDEEIARVVESFLKDVGWDHSDVVIGAVDANEYVATFIPNRLAEMRYPGAANDNG